MYDTVNSIFVFAASIFYILNLYKLYKDKQVKGISIASLVFFSCWNIWTLIFFLSTDYIYTTISYVLVSIINIIYLSLLYYYYKKNKRI